MCVKSLSRVKIFGGRPPCGFSLGERERDDAGEFEEFSGSLLTNFPAGGTRGSALVIRRI